MKKNRTLKKIELKKSIVTKFNAVDLTKFKGGSVTIGTNTKTCPASYLCGASATIETQTDECVQ